ncbi:hypothetical protein [Ferribacterium limneticum]|uniref:hypothetical protein n=1 Tax=Ferribacterium limneticum TaxID=76259 RepID=UPI001CF98E1D|nr:hypothetical protein [Ferribacterium limneticum]UCV28416.1 hypothetical protein KI617_19610 [Ferribacterium limneticum]UCV32333.1 hypothetical protein KI608_19610 [Ferribacterium limneticum]
MSKFEGYAMPTVQKMVPLAGGGRTGIKLDAPTWQAVEWLAGNAGQSWQQWCAGVIEQTPADENVTASIRETVMSGLLAETINAQRVSLHSIADHHPLLRYSAIQDDQEISEFMRLGEVWGTEDFGGFKVHAGRDEADQPCLWIENCMKGWPSLMLVQAADE